jgi:inner membrane transporter RhtA
MLLPRPRAITAAPPWSFFVGSAIFHYLGPAFAVLLFVRLEPLGVAGLRIWSAALVFALWRRPWRALARLDRDGRRTSRAALSALWAWPSLVACSLVPRSARSSVRTTPRASGALITVVAWAAVLAVMNASFYMAIDRLPLGTVAAIEFLPVIALAAFGARTVRNVAALVAAVGGVFVLTDVRLAGEPLGFVFAFANAGLFAAYIMLAHRAAQRFRGQGPVVEANRVGGIDGLAAAMLLACVFVAPLAAVQAAPALLDPIALAAGIGVGISSSVIPYVCDQLAMARMTRSTYALLVALLPATATVIGVIVLHQLPALAEIAGITLVIAGVALHREPAKETAKLPKEKID